MRNYMNKSFKQTLCLVPLMLSLLFAASCSAKETVASDAKEQPVAEQASVKAPVVVKGSVDAQYAALFDAAKEAVALGLEANPRNFVAGQHYDEFTTRQTITGPSDKIEVAEFFSYGCGHCFNSEPYMQAYAEQLPEDVNFVRIPVSFNPFFEHLARGYYAAKALGADEEAHIAIFDAIHIKRKDLSKPQALANFYSEYGVDKEKFLKSLNSFSVNTMIERDKKLGQAYQITGVPTIIVNGAYNTGGAKAGSFSAWFQILDVLVEKERALQ